MTRIASGVTDQGFYFVAVDATDFTTREPGLSTWTVYRERNNGSATAMTTPTITEADATNMPGVYFLLCDEDTTIDSGDVEQEQVYHITHTGMAPVTHAVTLFRPQVTAGNTLDVTSGGEAGLDFNNVNLPVGSIPALGWIDNGTGQAGASASTFVLRSAASFADDLVIGATIVLTGGTGVGQARVISDYVSSTDTATISPDWTTTPDNTTTYFVYPTAPAATATSALPAVNLTHVAGTSQTAGDLAALINTLDNFVDTEMAAVLALLDDPRGEPGQGSPPVNPDLATKIDYLYKAWRNRSTQTATEYALYADDGTTKDQEAACSSDGTTLVRGEVTTGA